MKPASLAERARVAALVDEGLHLSEIAARLGCSYDAARKRLRYFRLYIRPEAKARASRATYAAKAAAKAAARTTPPRPAPPAPTASPGEEQARARDAAEGSAKLLVALLRYHERRGCRIAADALTRWAA